MNLSGMYERSRRNPSQMYHPMHNSFASYWTETLQKSDMKYDLGDEVFLKNLHLIPDPLKKNLADTLITNEKPNNQEKNTMGNLKMDLNTQKSSPENRRRSPPETALGGIANFFSSVMNVLSGAMFRSRSPVNYYDCFEVENGHQGSSTSWQRAKISDRDKNGQAPDRQYCDAAPHSNESANMNAEGLAAVSSCESKLNQVRHLLASKPASSPVWTRKKPKKVFVEPGSLEESFEDAFSPEDFGSLSNELYIEYYSPPQYQYEEFMETAAPKAMLNQHIKDKIDIVQDVTSKNELELINNTAQNDLRLDVHLDSNLQLENANLQSANLELETNAVEKSVNNIEALNDFQDTKDRLVSSCEDKLSKLKELLQKQKKIGKTDITTEVVPIYSKSIEEKRPSKAVPLAKSADKHYKNPHRRTNKRQKSNLKCRIEDDLIFANEIDLETPTSIDNSPVMHTANFGEYFDEMKGRFRTVSSCSEDSFQIVFNDCSPPARLRTTSDCESEDSFIVFEESPDSCYTSNDVFGGSDLDSDSESDVSDSGCGMTSKLSHSLTRTVSNLADDSLYEECEDEVDCVCVNKCDVIGDTKTGLLLDDRKKLLKKVQPAKKVHFSEEPPKVHVMRVWAFAAKQARAGHWERYAIDRERFKRRIADTDMAVSWVLKPQHRSRVMFQRFMPWWNAERRKELAEKKQKLEEQRTKEDEIRKSKEESKLYEDEKKLDEEDSKSSKEESESHNEESESHNEESKPLDEESKSHKEKSELHRKENDLFKEGKQLQSKT